MAEWIESSALLPPLVAETEIVGIIVVPLPEWRPGPSPHDPELGWTTTDHDEVW